MFSSDGIIRMFASSKIGIYELSDSKYNDRLVYEKATAIDIHILASLPTGEGYRLWTVRLEINMSRKKAIKLFLQFLSIR